MIDSLKTFSRHLSITIIEFIGGDSENSHD